MVTVVRVEGLDPEMEARFAELGALMERAPYDEVADALEKFVAKLLARYTPDTVRVAMEKYAPTTFEAHCNASPAFRQWFGRDN